MSDNLQSFYNQNNLPLLLHSSKFSNGLECLGESKSRSRNKEKLDSELAAIEKLKLLYKKSNDQIRDLVGPDYASWL